MPTFKRISLNESKWTDYTPRGPFQGLGNTESDTWVSYLQGKSASQHWLCFSKLHMAFPALLLFSSSVPQQSTLLRITGLGWDSVIWDRALLCMILWMMVPLSKKCTRRRNFIEGIESQLWAMGTLSVQVSSLGQLYRCYWSTLYWISPPLERSLCKGEDKTMDSLEESV